MMVPLDKSNIHLEKEIYIRFPTVYKQECKDSNSNQTGWSRLCYHYTTPPTRTAAVINEMLSGFPGFHSRNRILIRYSKAGMVGFEPTYTAVKVLGLTA